MQENLVIVESPAKAKTIEKFLGKDYKVMSSYGHIRDLRKKEISIDNDTLEPYYEIPEEKTKLVNDLKANAKKAKKVWLASDEDREGEAISWHLCEVLNLDEEKTSRIVFHEITKSAIQNAIENPRHLDMNLVNAQQARRVLDRIVGFKLSPVLWRKVKPSLSAGRVQSVAVRLIVEREREVQSFNSEPYYRVSAIFTVNDAEGNPQELRAELSTRFHTHEDALAFLNKCKDAKFNISDIIKKPIKRTPAPPFTTSTLQQEAARKLGFSVSQTMMVAQRLYESGRITYMRTDSVNLSSLCLGASKEEIIKLYGNDYSHTRNYHTNSRGAQEAHEAIRPTYMADQEIDGNNQEKRLYELIWKRTLASQMADAQLEKTTIEISIVGMEEKFIANGETILFDGFIKVYRESNDEDGSDNYDSESNILPTVTNGQQIDAKEVQSVERFTLAPQRYSEASLVHKMEELGIGRPSTYAPTISTIQQREYVVKGENKGEERTFIVNTLKDGKIINTERKEQLQSEKGKLIPTDIGTVVNDFLIKNFPEIMDYNFTANVEEEFDLIAEGKKEWQNMMKTFDKSFSPNVDKVMNARQQHKAGERKLGIDPQSKKEVFVKIGRFGPVVQIGSADDEEKPRFAQLPSGMSIDTITLDEALTLFQLPRTLGELENVTISIGSGRFGPYIYHNKKYISLPAKYNPYTITLDEAIELINKQRNEEKQRHVKSFTENPDLNILNGRFGTYVSFNGSNFRLPKSMSERVEELTYEECMKFVDDSMARANKSSKKK